MSLRQKRITLIVAGLIVGNIISFSDYRIHLFWPKVLLGTAFWTLVAFLIRVWSALPMRGRRAAWMFGIFAVGGGAATAIRYSSLGPPAKAWCGVGLVVAALIFSLITRRRRAQMRQLGGQMSN